MTDDRFREIQLSGKQLVFIFMATAAVAVVIFLSGVAVGRGVRANRAAVGGVETQAPAAEAGGGAGPGAAAVLGRTNARPPADDELSYYKKLEGSTEASRQGGETAAGAAKEPRAVPPPDVIDRPVEGAPQAATATPPAEAKPRDRESAPAPSEAAAARRPGIGAPGGLADRPFAEPPGGGFALQVTALRDRGAAEAMARQLVAKGYTAYIVEPGGGSAAGIYRVRVGKFKTRAEADEVRRRLEKDQYKPILSR